MAELKFEITQRIGVLSENARGWTKELNMVSWNDREPKYDLREWSPDHSRMGKGAAVSARAPSGGLEVHRRALSGHLPF